MIGLLISLVILLIIFGLLWWLIDQLPLPEPFGRIARVVLIVVAVIILLYFLLGLAGHGDLRLGRL